MRLLFAIFAVSIVFSTALEAKPMKYRVWQLQDYNMDHIKRMIDMAAEQHVNRIQISHHIVMSAEQILDNPKRVEDFNQICKWAHEKNIKVDFWTHELDGVPDDLMVDGKVNLDDDRIWDFVREKYKKVFELCPELDGVVLTMHETGFKIFDDSQVSSSEPANVRITKLIDHMGEVMQELGKDYFVRTFVYEPWQLEYMEKGIKDAESNFVVMSKEVPHDWQPFYPNNPVIGNVGDREQIVEWDLGHEFTGLSTIPYINIDYFKKRFDYGIEKGTVGLVFRIERHKWRAVDTPNQMLIDLFTKLMLVPTLDPHKQYMYMLEDRYGKEAAPYLYSAFLRTGDIIKKGMYVLGYWITDHSILPSYNYASATLVRRSTAKWDPSTKEIGDELLNPTIQTIIKIQNEKDEAIAAAEMSIADVKAAREYLSKEDHDYLLEIFERSKAMAVVWKSFMEVFFGMSVYKSTGSKFDRSFLETAANRLEILFNQNKEHLIKLAADYDNPNRTSNIDNAMQYVNLAREALKESK
ncbi:MAG: hypothetical protein SNJ70_06700 [Armatimonadota bacterium]